MKKRVLKKWLLSVLAVLTVTGCAGKNPEDAVENAVTESAAEVSAVSEPYRETAQEESQATDTVARDVEGIHEPPSDVAPVYSDGTSDSRRKEPSQEQLEAALAALQYYFGITLDLAEYETSTVLWPEEIFEGELYKANTTVWFNALENRKVEGGAYVKPDYSVSFLENGEIKDIYLLGMSTVWEKAQKPPTVEEAKKLTKEFLISTKLFEEKNIECLGAGYANDTSIAVVYEDGKDGGIVVAVDVASGKIDCFDRMSRNRAMKWITPIETGSGKG